jgi:hypothetical protein
MSAIIARIASVSSSFVIVDRISYITSGVIIVATADAIYLSPAILLLSEKPDPFYAKMDRTRSMQCGVVERIFTEQESNILQG